MSEQQAQRRQQAQRQHQQRRQHSTAPGAQPVVVADVDISFGNMVKLMVKFAFAAIPAALIIWGVMLVFSVFVMSMLGGVGAILGGG